MSQPKIFLSYTWADSKYADSIDKDLKAVGITLIRDIRDFPKLDSLKQTMKIKIADADFVIVLLSKNYLESANCMFEAMELEKRPNAETLILPIIIDEHFFKIVKNRSYNTYWEKELKKAEEEQRNYPNDKTIRKQIEHCREVFNNIGSFIYLINKINVPSIEFLQKENYKTFLEKVGLSTDEQINFEELLRITQIKDREEQDIAIEKYMEENHCDAFGYFARANIAFERKEYKTAIHYYSKAIEFNPNYSDAYNNRGFAKSHLGDSNGEIGDYNSAIETNPKNSNAYFNRGFAKENLADYSGAIADYERAIEINPHDWKAYNNRGNAKVNLADYVGAITDYNRALEINPNIANANFNRGIAKGKLKDYKGEIADYDRAIEINSNNSSAYINRGYAKVVLTDYIGALTDFDRAIEINPNDSHTYYNRGYTKIQLEDYEVAKEDYDRAIEINPNFADAYYNRGIAKEALGDLKGAKEDIEKAIEIKKKNS